MNFGKSSSKVSFNMRCQCMFERFLPKKLAEYYNFSVMPLSLVPVISKSHCLLIFRMPRRVLRTAQWTRATQLCIRDAMTTAILPVRLMIQETSNLLNVAREIKEIFSNTQKTPKLPESRNGEASQREQFSLLAWPHRDCCGRLSI